MASTNGVASRSESRSAAINGIAIVGRPVLVAGPSSPSLANGTASTNGIGSGVVGASSYNGVASTNRRTSTNGIALTNGSTASNSIIQYTEAAFIGGIAGPAPSGLTRSLLLEHYPTNAAEWERTVDGAFMLFSEGRLLRCIGWCLSVLAVFRTHANLLETTSRSFLYYWLAASTQTLARVSSTPAEFEYLLFCEAMAGYGFGRYARKGTGGRILGCGHIVTHRGGWGKHGVS